MIPISFVEKHGEALPSTIFLKPPNGTEWKLNLVKRDDKIWFQKGWKEFAEYHSLGHGHLLVFRYERTSHFQVQIFDMSALEINYPFESVNGKMASNDQESNPPNNESMEHYKLSQKRKDNSPLEFLQPSRKRTCKCVEVENILKLPDTVLHHTDTKCEEKEVISNKKITVPDRASSFKPCNPSFSMVMYPSYVSGGNMCLPSKFCKMHFDVHQQYGDTDLQVLNGRVWPVKYQKRKAQTRFHFSRGWKTFVKDNNLQVGDVCTFELLPRTKLTFQVHIFRETDKSFQTVPHLKVGLMF
ncbi:B3 domain-containing transcription factor VRN1-like [Abrus precatorius]|uniref:B3 domain-containing transcription factor VRN1-like n=1 Tax=Abrus precatorius TaxID=3816 RepID=A0A8B8JX46_ABRPR|nr:B3 domain-containing transcription factor VRN1-like [Abrus precatorius]